MLLCVVVSLWFCRAILSHYALTIKWHPVSKRCKCTSHLKKYIKPYAFRFITLKCGFNNWLCCTLDLELCVADNLTEILMMTEHANNRLVEKQHIKYVVREKLVTCYNYSLKNKVNLTKVTVLSSRFHGWFEGEATAAIIGHFPSCTSRLRLI